MRVYVLELHFRVLRPILSLPFWHGARWSAWFREACKGFPFLLEQFCLGVYPHRYGQHPLRVGEIYRVKFIAAEEGIVFLPQFLLALNQCPNRGEFSSNSLALVSVTDLPSRAIIWRDNAPTGEKINIFSDSFLRPEIEYLRSIPEFTLRLSGPLRLPAPVSQRQSRMDKDRYFQPEKLLCPDGIKHLLAKIRFLEKENMDPFMKGINIDATRSSLQWMDMRYNQERRMALGGISGLIVFRGAPAFPLARRLVLGQFLGAGKNARFGLGYWHIPEISR